MQRKDKYHLIFTLFEEIHYMSVISLDSKWIYLFIYFRQNSEQIENFKFCLERIEKHWGKIVLNITILT